MSKDPCILGKLSYTSPNLIESWAFLETLPLLFTNIWRFSQPAVKFAQMCGLCILYLPNMKYMFKKISLKKCRKKYSSILWVFYLEDHPI